MPLSKEIVRTRKRRVASVRCVLSLRAAATGMVRSDHGNTSGRHNNRNAHRVFKTLLWRSVLNLETDDILEPVQVH